MKKHLVLMTSLLSLAALLLTNCRKIDESFLAGRTTRLNGVPVGKVSPVFDGTSSTANQLDNLTWDFARVTSFLTEIGSSPILQHGHVWSQDVPNPYITSDPQQSDFQTELGTVSELGVTPYAFTSYVEKLSPATRYFVRAYVVNRDGTFYGPSTQFQTKERGQY